MAPNLLVYTLSQLNKTPQDVIKSVAFYAQLRNNLQYVGTEQITFSRTSASPVRWRDGYYRSALINTPRFEYDALGNELGLLWEPARTNLALRSEEFDNASWVKSNVTVAANNVGTLDVKGTVTADLLTATAANATVIQDLGVIASASKVFTVFLKRKTGTGNIQITLNGGSSWTTVTITNAEWTRVQLIAVLANPDIGIRIVTSGDEIWAYGAQLEDIVTVPSSYIATTSAAVTRNADVFGYPLVNPIFTPLKTLIWVEDGVSKVNHLDGSPFSCVTGLWAGSTPVHIMEISGFDRALTDREIAIVRSALTGALVAVVPVTPPASNIIPFSQIVPQGELSALITHNIGSAGHKVFATASWPTTVGWSNKNSVDTTLNFNAQSPTGGGIVEGSIEL